MGITHRYKDTSSKNNNFKVAFYAIMSNFMTKKLWWLSPALCLQLSGHKTDAITDSFKATVVPVHSEIRGRELKVTKIWNKEWLKPTPWTFVTETTGLDLNSINPSLSVRLSPPNLFSSLL